MITGTPEFYIAVMDHIDWGTAHTVWGKLLNWEPVNKILALPYKNFTHPEFGTVMRMMTDKVPFSPQFEAAQQEL